MNPVQNPERIVRGNDASPVQMSGYLSKGIECEGNPLEQEDLMTQII